MNITAGHAIGIILLFMLLPHILGLLSEKAGNSKIAARKRKASRSSFRQYPTFPIQGEDDDLDLEM